MTMAGPFGRFRRTGYSGLIEDRSHGQTRDHFDELLLDPECAPAKVASSRHRYADPLAELLLGTA